MTNSELMKEMDAIIKRVFAQHSKEVIDMIAVEIQSRDFKTIDEVLKLLSELNDPTTKTSG